ncbi:unnamed protein product [Pleuronectes platessa]|uniref:Uncharacterized protein n=1 Tax=Pleuronectes platessa TaxID=8262 RepID=A0A9N7YBE3_PLEPL|nr:unnamed protein product [Pleuronectes platessa]
MNREDWLNGGGRSSVMSLIFHTALSKKTEERSLQLKEGAELKEETERKGGKKNFVFKLLSLGMTHHHTPPLHIVLPAAGRTLPAQKQQITAQQPTVEKAPSSLSLEPSADIVSHRAHGTTSPSLNTLISSEAGNHIPKILLPSTGTVRPHTTPSEKEQRLKWNSQCSVKPLKLSSLGLSYTNNSVALFPGSTTVPEGIQYPSQYLPWGRVSTQRRRAGQHAKIDFAPELRPTCDKKSGVVQLFGRLCETAFSKVLARAKQECVEKEDNPKQQTGGGPLKTMMRRSCGGQMRVIRLSGSQAADAYT